MLLRLVRLVRIEMHTNNRGTNRQAYQRHRHGVRSLLTLQLQLGNKTACESVDAILERPQDFEKCLRTTGVTYFFKSTTSMLGQSLTLIRHPSLLCNSKHTCQTHTLVAIGQRHGLEHSLAVKLRIRQHLVPYQSRRHFADYQHRFGRSRRVSASPPLTNHSLTVHVLAYSIYVVLRCVHFGQFSCSDQVHG